MVRKESMVLMGNIVWDIQIMFQPDSKRRSWQQQIKL